MGYGRIIILMMMTFFISACTHPDDTTTLHDETGKKSPNKQVSANYNIQLAMGYLSKGNTERAKEKLLRAAHETPDWPPLLDAMAYFYERTGDISMAKKYYERALSFAPTNGMAQNNYGTFLCRHGQFKEADEHFAAAVNDPNYVSPADAYENAALCAQQNKNLALAETYFKKALLQDPLRSSTLVELATLYYQQGNYRLAREYLHMIKPSEFNAQAHMLSVHIAKKRGIE